MGERKMKLQWADSFRQRVNALADVLGNLLVDAFHYLALFAIGAARWVSPPVPLWFRGLALVLGAAVWIGGILAQVYLFLLWLEGRAARLNRSSRGMEVVIPGGFLAYLKYSRALAPWILATVCVALPLAILAVNAPIAALLLVSIAILAPLLFKKLDS